MLEGGDKGGEKFGSVYLYYGALNFYITFFYIKINILNLFVW